MRLILNWAGNMERFMGKRFFAKSICFDFKYIANYISDKILGN